MLSVFKYKLDKDYIYFEKYQMLKAYVITDFYNKLAVSLDKKKSFLDHPSNVRGFLFRYFIPICQHVFRFEPQPVKYMYIFEKSGWMTRRNINGCTLWTFKV